MNSLLLDLLREGGYILYARHGEATIGEDRPGLVFGECTTQRNLSELGRRQAVYYGQLLRTLQIPVGYPIIASPFCRAVETGQLAFGQNSVQIDPVWLDAYNLSRNVTQQQRERILNELQSKMEINPPARNQSCYHSPQLSHRGCSGPDTGYGYGRPQAVRQRQRR